MTQRVLHVIPSLRYGSAARQLALLTAGIPRQGFECRVVSLGVADSGVAAIAAAGIDVEALGWRRALDLRPLWTLRQRIAAFQPDVIHAWQPAALQVVRLTGSCAAPVVLSRPVSGPPAGFRARLARWLIRAADYITVAGSAEAGRCRKLGFAEKTLRRARLGVNCPPPRAREQVLASLLSTISRAGSEPPRIAANARFVACVGPLEPHKGLAEAVWAFGILHYLYNDLHLLVIGSGPEASRLSKYARRLTNPDHVHLLGDRPDVPDLLGLCEAVWAPVWHGGAGAVLEAMAACRPVIAARTAETAELLSDGEAGVLVPPRHPVELVRQTRLLLDNEALRTRLGEAGRRRASCDFAVADMVLDYQCIYEDVIRGSSRMARGQPAAEHGRRITA